MIREHSGKTAEGGFTLVELLAAITILGIISFVLTAAIVLSLKTVGDTTARVGNSATTQTLESYFGGDAQSAEQVSSGTGTCGTAGPVVVNLAWTDQATPTMVSYAFEPLAGEELDLVRWFCVGTGTADKRVLGHYVSKPGDSLPVSASWTDSRITLAVQANSTSPGGDFVVGRRVVQ
jgi:prepilin-type N-terminal cleavage/methylation domain-containing protein